MTRGFKNLNDSLERRQKGYQIIYAWEQIEGLGESILNICVQKWGQKGRIIQGGIPQGINDKKAEKI